MSSSFAASVVNVADCSLADHTNATNQSVPSSTQSAANSNMNTNPTLVIVPTTNQSIPSIDQTQPITVPANVNTNQSICPDADQSITNNVNNCTQFIPEHRHNVSATSIETVCTDSAIADCGRSKRNSLDRRSQSSTSVDQIEVISSGGSPRGHLTPSAAKNESKTQTSIIPKNIFPKTSPFAKLFNSGSKHASKSKCEAASQPSGALIMQQRPENLPSKSAEENRRHQQQYEQMLEMIKKREKQTLKQQQQTDGQRQKQELAQSQAAHTWQTEYLPKFHEFRNNARCLQLWSQGLPSSVRGRVWALAVGNDLNITNDLFQICCERARAKQQETVKTRNDYTLDKQLSANMQVQDRESTIELIHLDAERTFVSLGLFQSGCPYHKMLLDLLGAYACYRPDIGYVQSMSFVAGVLLLNQDLSEAFITFANLLNWPLQRALYCLKQPQMTFYFVAYDQFFAQQAPKLHAHFQLLDIRPDLYLIEWLYTLYAKPLSLDVACRVWDLYTRDGEEVLFNTAIALLLLFESELLVSDFGSCVDCLCHVNEQILDCGRLFELIAAQPTWRQTSALNKRRHFALHLQAVTERLQLPQPHSSSLQPVGYGTQPGITVGYGSHQRVPSDTSSITSAHNLSGQSIKVSKSMTGFLNDWLGAQTQTPPLAIIQPISEQKGPTSDENGPISTEQCSASPSGLQSITDERKSPSIIIQPIIEADQTEHNGQTVHENIDVQLDTSVVVGHVTETEQQDLIVQKF